jgi:hypothetical protein
LKWVGAPECRWGHAADGASNCTEPSCATCARMGCCLLLSGAGVCFINPRVCMRACVCACVRVRAYVYPCAFVRARARARVRGCASECAHACPYGFVPLREPLPTIAAQSHARRREPARTCHALARRGLGMRLVGDLHCEAVAVEVNLDLLLCPVVLVAVSRAECTPAPRKRTGSPIRLVWGGLYTCNQRRENQRR